MIIALAFCVVLLAAVLMVIIYVHCQAYKEFQALRSRTDDLDRWVSAMLEHVVPSELRDRMTQTYRQMVEKEGNE